MYPYLDVMISSSERYTRECRPDDSWDAGEREADFEGVRVKLGLTPYDPGPVPFAKGDKVYVLIEKYRDGNTFGSQEYFDSKGVFATRAEAEAKQAALGTPNHGYFGDHLDWRIELAEVE